ncbi:MAG: hypothetical protein LBH04_07440 [Tannerellaceae bacterium]|nr:hypothetical protein [Tannerellaceae bacterium]
MTSINTANPPVCASPTRQSAHRQPTGLRTANSPVGAHAHEHPTELQPRTKAPSNRQRHTSPPARPHSRKTSSPPSPTH